MPLMEQKMMHSLMIWLGMEPIVVDEQVIDDDL